MKQVSEGSMGGRHGAQVSEGAKGAGKHGVQVKEGHKSTGKSNGPETTLRSGSLPSGNSLSAHGLSQGKNDAPSGESNHETLRHGNRPQAEKVKSVKHNQETLSRARMLNCRSEKGGAEKNGGY